MDNHQLRLRRRPEGIPSDADFESTREPVPAADALADGQVLLRNLYLSIDPTIRGWIDRDTYLPAVKLGDANQWHRKPSQALELHDLTRGCHKFARLRLA